MGAKVIAVSKHEWVRETDFGGADYVINDYGKVVRSSKRNYTRKNGRCCSKFLGHRNMG